MQWSSVNKFKTLITFLCKNENIQGCSLLKESKILSKKMFQDVIKQCESKNINNKCLQFVLQIIEMYDDPNQLSILFDLNESVENESLIDILDRDDYHGLKNIITAISSIKLRVYLFAIDCLNIYICAYMHARI